MRKQIKFIFIFVFLIFLTSVVSASECGITNLASCIPEKLAEFLLYLINLPIQPILNLIHNLLTEPVNVDIFSSIWSVIIYMLSLFYGLLLVITGFRFLVSGHSPEQREKAKSSLASILIMMVLIQASFFLYSLAIELMASMSAAMINIINQDFFLLTVDNLANIGLELLFTFPYLMALTFTLILLVLRYICVSAGVVFVAVGIFFYFIEPLNQYGRLILNGLAVLIALPFFYAVIFLTSSKLLEIAVFSNFKILVMIGAFSLVNLGTLLLLFFVILKAALKLSSTAGKVAAVVQMVS
jgi:hypothetical protein